LSGKTHNTLLISLAQILLQCTACWAHLTKFIGTFHKTAQQCCKCQESFIFSFLGHPLTLKPHFWVWFRMKVVQNWMTSIHSYNT
jgi:hypothetical protein